MFDDLQGAIALAEEEKRRDNDGGVPVFSKKAVAQRVGEEVEWTDVTWVTIFNKGDPKNIMERPIRPEDKLRWPKHWEAFLADEEPDFDGIPLSEFPQITPAERERCKALHLRTVEDVADYPDGNIKNLGGRGFALKKAAAEFVAYKAGESVTDLLKRIAKLEKELKSGTNSTTNRKKRGTGNKSAGPNKPNKGGKRPKRKSVSDPGDDLPAAGEA